VVRLKLSAKPNPRPEPVCVTRQFCRISASSRPSSSDSEGWTNENPHECSITDPGRLRLRFASWYPSRRYTASPMDGFQSGTIFNLGGLGNGRGNGIFSPVTFPHSSDSYPFAWAAAHRQRCVNSFVRFLARYVVRGESVASAGGANALSSSLRRFRLR
jgi:hypothetical protein